MEGVRYVYLSRRASREESGARLKPGAATFCCVRSEQQSAGQNHLIGTLDDDAELGKRRNRTTFELCPNEQVETQVRVITLHAGRNILNQQARNIQSSPNIRRQRRHFRNPEIVGQVAVGFKVIEVEI